MLQIELERTCSGLFFFFFNDTATTEIYTLSLHDALPISSNCRASIAFQTTFNPEVNVCISERDRKSTRLNSSHSQISYAVFCLKKKNNLAYVCDECQLAASPSQPALDPAVLSSHLLPLTH